MVLAVPGDFDPIRPGQFLNLYLPGTQFLLPRPFSIFDADPREVHVLYKVVGPGTRLLSELAPGKKIKTLCPLGTPFPEARGQSPCLIGGGIGIAPLYFWMRRRRENDPEAALPTVYYGAADRGHLVAEEALRSLGASQVLATDDGSSGFPGTCIDAFEKNLEEGFSPDTVFACGPVPMLRDAARVCRKHSLPLYCSLEEVMGCGYGACVGCAVRVKVPDGEVPYRLICKDGPVFDAAEIDWDYF
jgi:dihydroorotate dehydrogenase electron transfer subunit